MPRALPEPEVFEGEVVDLRPTTPAPALPVPATGPAARRAAFWGGRVVHGAREAPIAQVGVRRDARVPAQLLFPRVFDEDMETDATVLWKHRGTAEQYVAPRVVVEPAAIAAILRVGGRYGDFSYRPVTSAVAVLLRALELRLAQERPSPGTHFPVVIDFDATPGHRAAQRPPKATYPMPYAGLHFALTHKQSAVPLHAWAARMGDGDLAVIVDLERAAEAPLPRWFPGMPAQELPERQLTTAQQHMAAKIVGDARKRPLRVDLHADGRARVVEVTLNAPRGHFLASDKLRPDGSLSARYISPIGTFLRDHLHDALLEDSPLWRTVADIRLAPSPEAAAKPTFAHSSEEYVEAARSKQRGAIAHALQQHWSAVGHALRTGRPVAPEVLAEYPALVAFYAESLRAGKSRAEVEAERDAEQRANDYADDPDVTVHWSVQEGLLLYTRGKDPKIIDAIRALRGSVAGFKWSRPLGAWYRPQSVGVSVSTTPIDAVARELRRAGLVVRVERGGTDVVLGEANERRQDHKFWRADLYAGRAGAAVGRGEAFEDKADAIRADIPVGAPTRRAERAEARAERAEEKAEGEYAYAGHAASAAENLARTAAGYDVTAEITRKQAERRADAFADLFVRKVKGRVGALSISSKKTDNLSEYSILWGVGYPASAKMAASVSYDGRVVKVSVAGESGRSVVLREDVTRLDAEAVFEKVVAALPKVAEDASDPAARVVDDPVVFQKELSAYGSRRASTALTASFNPAARFKLQLWSARHMYNDWRNMSVEEVRDRDSGGFPTGNSVALVPVSGLTFRIVAHRVVDEQSLYRMSHDKKTRLVGEASVDFTGMPIGVAWDLFVAHAAAMMSGKPFVPPKSARATLAPRKDAREAAMRGTGSRAGVGTVQDLPRDAADAAARGRVDDLAARTRAVAADAAARLAARRGSPREVHADLIAAARAAGNSFGFYPTSPTLAAHVVELAELRPGARVLEPSAGMGGLVEPLVARGANVVAVEFQADRANYLASAWADQGVDVRVGDFMAVPPSGSFDAVVMNPPFSIEGRRYTDAEHALHALGFLRPGGRLVAILSPETPRRSDKKSEALRAALRGWDVRWEPVDPGRFRMSGTDIPVTLLIATRPA